MAPHASVGSGLRRSGSRLIVAVFAVLAVMATFVPAQARAAVEGISVAVSTKCVNVGSEDKSERDSLDVYVDFANNTAEEVVVESSYIDRGQTYRQATNTLPIGGEAVRVRYNVMSDITVVATVGDEEILRQFVGFVENLVDCPAPPQPEPVDSDGDGVTDDVDQCLNEAGPASNNGCPVIEQPGLTPSVDLVIEGSQVDVVVTNPNPGSVDYVVTVGGERQSVTVPGGSARTVTFTFSPGTYAGSVTGNNNTSAEFTVIVAQPEPVDTDGDGVPDGQDKCSNTPAGVTVDANGCASSQLDSDGDGVTDDVDQCLNEAGLASNNGCPVIEQPNSNKAPKAKNDTIKTTVNNSVTANVLGNDTDSNGDTLVVASVTQPQHGTVVLKHGEVIYMPKADFHGADHFSYTVSDGNGGVDTAKVVVVVQKAVVSNPPVGPIGSDVEWGQQGREFAQPGCDYGQAAQFHFVLSPHGVTLVEAGTVHLTFEDGLTVSGEGSLNKDGSAGYYADGGNASAVSAVVRGAKWTGNGSPQLVLSSSDCLGDALPPVGPIVNPEPGPSGPGKDDFEVYTFAPNCYLPVVVVTGRYLPGTEEIAVMLERRGDEGNFVVESSLERPENGFFYLEGEPLMSGESRDYRVSSTFLDDSTSKTVLTEFSATSPTEGECREFAPLPTEQQVTVVAECGAVTFTNNADEAVVVLYGTYELPAPDGEIVVESGASVRVETARSSLDWQAFTLDNQQLAGGSGEASLRVSQDCKVVTPVTPVAPVVATPVVNKPVTVVPKFGAPVMSHRPTIFVCPQGTEAVDRNRNGVIDPADACKPAAAASSDVGKRYYAQTGVEEVESEENLMLSILVGLGIVGLVLVVQLVFRRSRGGRAN